MKKFLIIIILTSWNVSGQSLFLKILGKNATETKVIDSISYSKKILNSKLIFDEVNTISEKLSKLGFVDNIILDQKKLNDSVFEFDFSLGKKIKFIHIYIGKNSDLKNLPIFESKTDTLILPFNDIEKYLNLSIQKLEQKGFALSKLKLINLTRKRDYFEAELFLVSDKKRILNHFVFNGYEKFPNGYKHNLEKKYKNSIFNQENLNKINTDLNKIAFVKQTKFPEILFKKDSTNIYVYLEKSKSNKFDGLIGFSNDENQKTKINGFVDLNLNNILNVGEKIAVFWKNDGENQKTFNAAIELPYVFRTSLATRASLNIFSQDSTFQNSKSEINLGYYLGFNSKTYLGYQESESNDIKNTNSINLTDFKNNFTTIAFETDNYLSNKNYNAYFDNKNKFQIKFGFGERKTKTDNLNQYFANLNFEHFIYVNKNNVLKIKSENYFLKSDTYKTNELYRFGGINSIRGFSENSLQANLANTIITEYQYFLTPTLYIHSILDYGYYEDKINNAQNKLLGLGFGFGLVTKNGIFNLIYANGSSNQQPITTSNSIIQVSLNGKF